MDGLCPKDETLVKGICVLLKGGRREMTPLSWWGEGISKSYVHQRKRHSLPQPPIYPKSAISNVTSGSWPLELRETRVHYLNLQVTAAPPDRATSLALKTLCSGSHLRDSGLWSYSSVL